MCDSFRTGRRSMAGRRRRVGGATALKNRRSVCRPAAAAAEAGPANVNVWRCHQPVRIQSESNLIRDRDSALHDRTMTAAAISIGGTVIAVRLPLRLIRRQKVRNGSAAVALSDETVRYNFSLSYRAQNTDEKRAQGEDVELLKRIALRDQSALGELYDGHSPRLFGFILRILRDRGEAEEVLQEVFVQAWTRATTYNVDLGSPAAWLIGIARNRAIDRLRANAVRARSVEAAPEPAPMETPERHAAAARRRRDVQRALNALPSEQRELIEQAFFFGFNYSELAAR